MPDHLGNPGRVGPGGNIPVYFEVLSYAGTLTVTAIADPDHFPDLDTLTDALRDELDLIIRHPTGSALRSTRQE